MMNATKNTAQRKKVDTLLIGWQKIMGTDWPVESYVTRETDSSTSRPRWVVTHRQCNGTADNPTKHTTRREALEALQADGVIESIPAVVLHGQTGADMEEADDLSVRLLTAREIEALPPVIADRWRMVEAEDSGECRHRRLAVTVESETTTGGFFCLV
jgi:hypothetical protein